MTRSGTDRYRLIAFDPGGAGRFLVDPSAFARTHAVSIPSDVLADLIGVMEHETRMSALAGCWTSFMVVDGAASEAIATTGEVVGTAAYKSAPVAGGTVEIAYFVFPAREGRGAATAAARLLTALALHTYRVARVTARTLPERNASCRVLEKAGFRLLGTVDDPEDGSVWEWEYSGPIRPSDNEIP